MFCKNATNIEAVDPGYPVLRGEDFETWRIKFIVIGVPVFCKIATDNETVATREKGCCVFLEPEQGDPINTFE